MGIIGCFFIGLGLISVVGVLDNQYWGLAVTSIPLGIGTILILISSFIMYTPSIYSKINEQYVSFYFLIWAILVVSAIYYLFFRKAIYNYLREQGISKTRIKSTMNGARNFWWYEEAHKAFDFKWIYRLNKWFTVLFSSTVAIHLLLGWWYVVSPAVTFGVSASLIMNAFMWNLVVSTWKHGGSDDRNMSAIRLMIGFVLPIAGCIAVIKYFFEVLW